MPTDPSDLMGKVYDYFSGLYATASKTQAFLAFEPLGLPMPASSFKDNATDAALDPAMATYILSLVADTTCAVNGSSLVRGSLKLNTIMKLFLEGSLPADASGAPLVGAAKLDAQEAFGSTLPVPGPIPQRYYPAVAQPANWYDPAVGDNWATYSSETAKPAAAAVPPPPPLPRPFPDRSTDLACSRASPKPVARSRPRGRFRPVFVPALRWRPPTSGCFRGMEPIMAAPVAAPPGLFFARPSTVFHPATSAVLHVEPPPVVSGPPAPPPPPPPKPQPVATNGISISFEHCVCTLDRPWVPDALLLLRDWFVPGYMRGEFSNGTGAGDAGLAASIVTTGFVAVRNLKITAQWSAADLQAIQSSPSFGPFTIDGHLDAGTGTVSFAGIQIVGWFCAPFPDLPPVSDPSLAPPAPPANPPAAPGA